MKPTGRYRGGQGMNQGKPGRLCANARDEKQRKGGAEQTQHRLQTDKGLYGHKSA